MTPKLSYRQFDDSHVPAVRVVEIFRTDQLQAPEGRSLGKVVRRGSSAQPWVSDVPLTERLCSRLTLPGEHTEREVFEAVRATYDALERGAGPLPDGGYPVAQDRPAKPWFEAAIAKGITPMKVSFTEHTGSTAVHVGAMYHSREDPPWRGWFSDDGLARYLGGQVHYSIEQAPEAVADEVVKLLELKGVPAAQRWVLQDVPEPESDEVFVVEPEGAEGLLRDLWVASEAKRVAKDAYRKAAQHHRHLLEEVGRL